MTTKVFDFFGFHPDVFILKNGISVAYFEIIIKLLEFYNIW